MILNISKMLVSGSHVVKAIRPPLRVTRANSDAAAFGRLANMIPHVERDRVERAVLKGQAFRVADPISDVEPRGPRPLPCGSDQILAEIDADHRGPASGDQARGPAGSGRQIQNPLAGARPQAQHGMLDRVRNAATDFLVAGAARIPNGCGFLVVRLNSRADALFMTAVP